MKQKPQDILWPDNPVVEEVRRARRQLLEQAGGTVAGLMELIGRRAETQKLSDAPPRAKRKQRRNKPAVSARRRPRR